MSDSLWPHGLQPSKFLCPWEFPGNTTGVCSHFLLQGIFPTQGLNPSVLQVTCIADRFFTIEPPSCISAAHNSFSKSPSISQFHLSREDVDYLGFYMIQNFDLWCMEYPEIKFPILVLGTGLRKQRVCIQMGTYQVLRLRGGIRFNGVGQRQSKMCLARMGFKIWSYIGNLRYQDSREHRISSRSNKMSGSTKCSMDAYLMGITSLTISSKELGYVPVSENTRS